MKKILSCQKQRDAWCLNEAAFTLIEALFALSIFSIIVTFMMPIFQIMLDEKDSEVRIQEMEWEIFCSQIKKEIRMSTRAEVISNRLILAQDSDTILYEKYGNNLRRRVNFTGHEIVLQNVSEFTFTLLNNAVKITVNDTWGNEHSVIAYSFVNWNPAP